MNPSIAVAVLFVGFKASTLLFAPADTLNRYLGPELPKDRHTTFSTYRAPGFSRVVVDAAGPKMRHLDFFFTGLVPPNQALRTLGINPAPVHPISRPAFYSNGGMNRARADLIGASIAPSGGKPWKVAYDETAVVDKAKLHTLKTQISNATGPARLALIRSCDKWQSVLHLTAP